MICFVRTFALTVGEMVPQDDPVWQLYLILLQITEIITSTSVTVNTIALSENLITEHHDLYISLFDDYLKSKHHFLMHCPSLVLKIGP